MARPNVYSANIQRLPRRVDSFEEGDIYSPENKKLPRIISPNDDPQAAINNMTKYNNSAQTDWSQYEVPSATDWTRYAVPEQQMQQQQQPPQQRSWTDSPLMSGVYGASNQFDKLAHGILQPVFESGVLGDNWAQGSKDVAREREDLLKRSEQVNPASTAIGQGVGEALKYAPLAAAGPAGIFSLILAGGAGGAAMGGAEYANEDESRLENALKGGAEGVAFGALPGIGKGFKAAGKYVVNIPKALQPQKIANEILKGKQFAEKTSKNLFNSFLKEGEKANIKVGVPKSTKSLINQDTPKSYKKSLNRWIEDPNIKNSHDLYKKTGKLERDIGGKIQANTASNAERDTYEAAKKLHGKVEKNMKKALKSSGRDDLVKSFSEANKHYVEQVLPHRNSLIREHIGVPGKKGSTASDFVKGLSNQKLFKKELAGQYPAVGVRSSLPYTGATGALGAAQYFGLPSKLFQYLTKGSE